jgi:hypothetical protein
LGEESKTAADACAVVTNDVPRPQPAASLHDPSELLHHGTITLKPPHVIDNPSGPEKLQNTPIIARRKTTDPGHSA